MDDLHEKLLRIGFAADDQLGLVLAGGYAMVAHGVVDRPSQDIDFATATAIPLPEVVDRLSAAYEKAGFTVTIIEGTMRMARLTVAAAGVVCEVDVLKEALGPPARLQIGPVLSFEDAVGLKMRALHDRSAHRDFIDVHGASRHVSWIELEQLGAAHTVGFSLDELADRLNAFGNLDDRTFAQYGLTEADVKLLASWVTAWESDIRERLAAGEEGPDGLAHSEWDAYLDD